MEEITKKFRRISWIIVVLTIVLAAILTFMIFTSI